MLSQQEWVEISRDLQDHHALFDEMWQMGRPYFTEELETAAVRFSEYGEFLEFIFNPMFWDALNSYERTFVIAHEILHVALNHGQRTTIHEDAPRINRSLDVVVNHLLVDSFGFDRTKIRDQASLCWVDTVFTDTPDKIPTNESYEYYYRMVPESMKMEVYTLDDHSMLGGDFSKVIEKLNERLTHEEKEVLKGIIKKHCPENEAGKGTGGWTFVNVKKTKHKRKWETIISKWSQKYIKQGIEDQEQWARVHRRFELLPTDLLLPSEMEDDSVEKDRLPVFLFLDTSGSCWGYKERFFKAGMSLPEDRFDVRLFCFDTSVKETTIKSQKIYGGGGTNFGIIEGHIQKLIKTEKISYPEGVFIITDGMGSSVRPEHPKKWHWFLTPRGSSRYTDGCKVFKLEDFE